MARQLDVLSKYSESTSWLDLEAGEITELPSKDLIRFYALTAIPCLLSYRLNEQSEWQDMHSNQESPVLDGTGPIEVLCDLRARCAVSEFTFTETEDTSGRDVVSATSGGRFRELED